MVNFLSVIFEKARKARGDMLRRYGWTDWPNLSCWAYRSIVLQFFIATKSSSFV